jgi:hypothetical protein
MSAELNENPPSLAVLFLPRHRRPGAFLKTLLLSLTGL